MGRNFQMMQWLRLLRPRHGAKPSFVVLGVQRGGTTSLNHYMRAHPNIHFNTDENEIHFFDLNLNRGEKWYLAHFPDESQLARWRARDGAAVTGDSSPYYLFHPLVPERLKAFAPDAKLIVLLRDPVERAISHYHHSVRRGRETLPLAEALAAESERLKSEAERIQSNPLYRGRAHRSYSYFSRGLYREQIDRWLALFPRRQFLFLRSELLFGNPDQAFARVCEFLRVPVVSVQNYKVHNQGRYPDLDPKIVADLRARYHRPNERVVALLGEEFDFNRAGSMSRAG